MSDPIQVHVPFLKIAEIIREQSTGTFSVQADKVIRQFHFNGGNVVGAVSNAKSELPGTYLHKEKKLTAEQYQTYLAEVRKPKSDLWKLAFTIGAISIPDQSKFAWNYAVHLGTLLLTSQGQTQFHPLPSKAVTPLGQGLRFLIEALSGAQRETLRILCPEFDSTSSIYVDEKVEKARTPLPLSPEEKGLLTVIRTNAKLNEVFSSSFLGQDRIERLIVSFFLHGIVKLESAELSAQKTHEATLTPQDRNFVEEIRGLLFQLDRTTYYEWLKVSPTSDRDVISQAAATWVERLSASRVDQIFHGEEARLPGLLKEKLIEAKNVLTDSAQRAEYDSYISLGKKGSFVDQSSVVKEQDLLRQTVGLEKNAVSKLERALGELPQSQALIARYAQVVLKNFGAKNAEYRERVLAEFRRALQMRPVEAVIYEAYGAWMEELALNEKAIDAYKRALSLSPYSQSTREALTKLAPNEVNALTVSALHKNLNQLNHYEILSLDPHASVREIQKSYRDATKRFHPDRFYQTSDPVIKENANKVYKQMVKAYTTLKSATKRSEYDEQLAKKRAAPATERKPSSDSLAGYGGDETPQTHQGKKFFELALLALRQGKVDAAKLNLKLGLQVEPDSIALQKKLKELN